MGQRFIDSLYERNYNAILFKKKGGQYAFRLLATEDAGSFIAIGNAFFQK